MSDDLTIEEYLEDLRGRIQIKLAQGRAPADSDTLRMVCVAMALVVVDPYNLKALMAPSRPHIYERAQALLADVARDFAEEIAELRDVIADAQEDPAWHASVEEGKDMGDIPTDKDDREAIAQMILALLLSLDEG